MNDVSRCAVRLATLSAFIIYDFLDAFTKYSKGTQCIFVLRTTHVEIYRTWRKAYSYRNNRRSKRRCIARHINVRRFFFFFWYKWRRIEGYTFIRANDWLIIENPPFRASIRTIVSRDCAITSFDSSAPQRNFTLTRISLYFGTRLFRDTDTVASKRGIGEKVCVRASVLSGNQVGLDKMNIGYQGNNLGI